MSTHSNNPIGDENVARLIGQAYRPELPDPQFVQSLTERMIAETTKTSDRLTPLATTPVEPAKQLSPLAVLGFWAVAASLLLMATFWRSANPRKPPTEQASAPPTHAPVREGIDSIGQAGLVARPQSADVSRRTAQPGETIATGDHERSVVSLVDGSTLYLNRGTEVRIDAPRKVTLARGEIFVEVSPREPATDGATFYVQARGREVTALGTKFAVKADAATSGVVVTQGKVRVDGETALVHAGQQLVENADDSGPAVSPAPRASHVLDWTRDLMAAIQPLVPASRYEGGALVIAGAEGQQDQLSLRKMHVDVHIEDGFARTTIDQTYFNHLNSRVEGTFYFPLPPGASISRLAMYVNGKLMEGGMAEREHARQVFETIKYRSLDPALLEWIDGSMFKMRVFPLEGRQEKRIVLSYSQRLESLYGRTHYRFPAGHSLEQVGRWSTEIRLRGGADVHWTSPSHDLQPKKDDGDLVLSATAEKIKPDRDLVLSFDDDRPSPASDEPRFSTSEHEGHRYLMVRYRPKLETALRRERRDWIFLVETSADRDPLLARAQADVLATILDNIEHDDTIAVVTAGTNVALLANELRPATAENIAAARRFVEQAHLVGALDMERALAATAPLVRAAGNPYLVHIGSGVPVLGTRTDDALVKKLPPRARYIGVGVGKRWNRNFMRATAATSGGYFTQINPDEPIAWRAFDLVATLNAPRLLNLEVQDAEGKTKFLAWNDTLAQGEELCAVARLDASQPLPKAVVVSGKLDGQPYRVELPMRKVAEKANHLPRTWSKLEIDRLLATDAAAHKAEIIALSKAMYVMSPYTSLLVLENDDMYRQYNVDRGRKDHWALYPCPAEIPVVHEPLPAPPVVPLVTKPQTEAQPVVGPSVEQVLNTIAVRSYRAGLMHWVTPRIIIQEEEEPLLEALSDLNGRRYRDPVRLNFNSLTDREVYFELRNGLMTSPYLNYSVGVDADEDYDAPDFNNLILARQRWNTAMSRWEVDIPSLRRPELMYYWTPGQPDASIYQSWSSHYEVEDVIHDNDDILMFTTKNYEQPFVGPGALTTESWDKPLSTRQRIILRPDSFIQTRNRYFDAINGPWDVDNDHDGLRDSVWADLSAPVMPQLTGSMYKPLFAVLQLDVNGRVNLREELPTGVFGDPVILPGRYGEIEQRAARWRHWWSMLSQGDAESPSFDDATSVMYPDAQIWQRLLERRQRHNAIGSELSGDGSLSTSRALNETMSLEVIEQPLVDVIEHLKTKHRVDIQLDTKSLAESGVDPTSTLITRNLKDISLRSALRLLLREYDATYVVRDDVVVVTSRDGADGLRLAHVYPVADLMLPPGVNTWRSFSDLLLSGTMASHDKREAISNRDQVTGTQYSVPASPTQGEPGAVANQTSAKTTLSTKEQADEKRQAAFADAIRWRLANNVRPAVLYEPPSAAVDPAMFRDLLRYAPGMNTNSADVTAVVEDEAGQAKRPLAGEIDPKARQLIEQARGGSWQRVTLTSDKDAPVQVIEIDGTGRFHYQRATDHGLVEEVICDNQTLWHLYPELGVGAKRKLTRFHWAALEVLVPWTLPPAETLAIGADLRLVDDHTVAIVPHVSADKDAPKPERKTEWRFVFAGDKLVERKRIELPSGKLLGRATYAADGTVRTFDATGKEVSVRRYTIEPCGAPGLEPDAKLVVLPLPARTRAHVFQSTGRTNDRIFSSWNMDDALRLIATDLAEGNSELADVIGQRFIAQGDRRTGFFTLLVSSAGGWDPTHTVFTNVKLEMNPPASPAMKFLRNSAEDLSPLANYLRAHRRMKPGEAAPQLADNASSGISSGLLGQLTELHWLCQHLLPGTSHEVHDRALAFVTQSRVPKFRWIVLRRLATLTSDLETQRRIVAEYEKLSREPGFSFAARYEQARALLATNDWDAAQKLFAKLHTEALAAGMLPPVDSAFRQAFRNRADWDKLVRDTFDACLKKGHGPWAVRAAWQCHELDDTVLAEELCNRALAEAPEKHRLATTLAAVEFYARSKRFARADALLVPLIQESRVAPQAAWWRVAAAMAKREKLLSRAISYFENALALEYANLGDKIDLEKVRRDYAELLKQYGELAGATATPGESASTELAARIVRAVDRWRSLDTDPTAACQAASHTLASLGAQDAAWEYLTTPLANKPNEATPWVSLAQSLSSQGDFELADRAYASAFDIEPTNAQILWDRAQLLDQRGKPDDAGRLYRQLADGTWQPAFNWIQQQARTKVESTK
jgi:tetratricopeptide (TPR) repeat protein